MVSLKNIPGKSALYHLPASSSPKPDTSKGRITLKDMGVTDKINLRCAPDNQIIARGLDKVIGTTLPQANRINVSGLRSIVWCGPDEWMILTGAGLAEIIMAELDVPQAGHVAVTNVSDALGGIYISGTHSRDVLAKHCSLDFRPEVFTRGMAQQSLLSHASVTIICREQNDFLIMGRTSFMPYIAALMMDAAIEYGYNFYPA